jgi:hypothetical protein
MAIEIRELVIKATVVQDGEGAAASPAPATNNSVSPSEELVNLCIEKVLEILKNKHER